eukprot:UC1_evm2s1245
MEIVDFILCLQRASFQCKSCKIVSYCSVEHQRADWPHHRKVCKAFQSIHDLTLFPSLPVPCTDEEWWSNRQAAFKAIQVLMSLMASGQLSEVEREMVFFARHCEVCHTTDRELLEPCHGCHMVSYCCEEHRRRDLPRHGPVCQRMLFALRCMQASRAYNLPPVWIPPRLLEKFAPLPTDWMSYMAVSGLPRLPGPEMAYITNVLSTPLSVLYGMQQIMPDIGKVNQLVLRLVGATHNKEMLALTKYEEILHQLPGLQSLFVLLIGPGLDCPAGVTEAENLLCDTCLSRHRNLSVLYCSDLYHESVEPGSAVATLSDSGTPGTVITALLNSGLDEAQEADADDPPVDMWRPTIELLVEEGHPVIVTSRHRVESEAVHLTLRDDYGAKISLEPEPNPYAGLVPMRQPCPPADDCVLYHDNQFVMAFQGSAAAKRVKEEEEMNMEKGDKKEEGGVIDVTEENAKMSGSSSEARGIAEVETREESACKGRN